MNNYYAPRRAASRAMYPRIGAVADDFPAPRITGTRVLNLNDTCTIINALAGYADVMQDADEQEATRAKALLDYIMGMGVDDRMALDGGAVEEVTA